MKLIFCYSDEGEEIANLIKDEIGAISYRSGKTDFSIKEYIKSNWLSISAIIFICSTGIAVRMIGDALVSKAVDPAVVVIDDTGKNVISLLSGHLGGANELTNKLASMLDAYPVITTSTDNHGIEGIDDFARKNGYVISDIKKILPIAKLMLAGKKLGFYSPYGAEPVYGNLRRIEKLIDIEVDAVAVVSPFMEENLKLPYIWMYPKVINLGIGCRKGVSGERIITVIENKFSELNLSPLSISKIGTVEAKKKEEGIRHASEYFKAELRVFTNEEISVVEDLFEKSDFVKRTIGVYNASAPAAHLLGGRMLVEKYISDDITLSITLED